MSKNIFISLIGEEPVANYRVLKEFTPDLAIHIVTSKTKKISKTIANQLQEKVAIQEIEVDPWNYRENLEKLRVLTQSLSIEDYININITGGTKIMSVALIDYMNSLKALGEIDEAKLNFLYINIDPQEINYYMKGKLEKFCDSISIEEVVQLYQQKVKSFYRYNDLESEYLDAFLTIMPHFKEKYWKNLKEKFTKISFAYEEQKNKVKSLYDFFNQNATTLAHVSKFKIEWSNTDFCVLNHDDTPLFELALSPKQIEWFLFHAGWFEFAVAHELSKKYAHESIYLNVVFPRLKNQTEDKNDVDIIVNKDGQLIFYECKSGNVKDPDINVIKTRKDVYGGLNSKNILVSFYPIAQEQFEKCNDAKIQHLLYPKVI
jgi:hypothetical protein